MEKIAVYAGSFDPFTNGHLSIVKSAAELFDTVYIVIAQNCNKKRFISADNMSRAIEKCFVREGLVNCKVEVCFGLVADFCKEVDAKYLVRGLRNTSDYMYEENVAKINAEINPNLKTIYFRATNDTISSSMVRELHSYDRDVSKYLPYEIGDVLRLVE
jgi:pantetheine-phosphate adenylyltransferase